jgi:hypothetical protein
MKNQTKKEIIYPIFLECFQFIKDTFWENIFEDLSYGKCPYGTYINKGFLCCNYKGKEFNYKIEKKNPEQLYKDTYNLLVKKIGLQSQRDKIKNKTNFQNIENEIKEYRKSWNTIRKKNIKDLLIEKYIIEIKNKHSLSIVQCKKLHSYINIAIILKSITSKDIEYKDGVITNIKGISFKKNQIIYEKDIYNIYDKENRNCILIEKNYMSDSWDKYLIYLRKLL